jgi:hypothetical protein
MNKELQKWVARRVEDCDKLDKQSEENRTTRLKGENFWNVLSWTLGLPSAVLTVIAASVSTASEGTMHSVATVVTLASAVVASIVTYCQAGARKQNAKRLAAQWNAIRVTLPQVCDGLSSSDKLTRDHALKDLQTLQGRAATLEGWSTADALPDWDPVTRLSLAAPPDDPDTGNDGVPQARRLTGDIGDQTAIGDGKLPAANDGDVPSDADGTDAASQNDPALEGAAGKSDAPAIPPGDSGHT